MHNPYHLYYNQNCQSIFIDPMQFKDSVVRHHFSKNHSTTRNTLSNNHTIFPIQTLATIAPRWLLSLTFLDFDLALKRKEKFCYCRLDLVEHQWISRFPDMAFFALVPLLGRAGLPIVRFGVKTPARAEIWFEISVPPAPTSQLSYYKYIDCTLSVGRWDSFFWFSAY